MKKILIIFALLFGVPCFATDLSIDWVNGDSNTTTSTCTIGDSLILPSAPTKSGYNFVGWEAFKKLQYVENAASTLVDTGITANQDNIEMEILFDAVTGSNYLFQARDSSGILGISGSSSGNTILANFPGGTSAVSSITRTAGNQYYVRETLNNGTITLYVKNMTTNAEDTKTGSYTFSPYNVPVCLFGNTNGNRLNAGAHIYYAKMKINNVYVMNYVPAKRASDNAIGFVDLVTGEFKTATSGSLIAGPNAQ